MAVAGILPLVVVVVEVGVAEVAHPVLESPGEQYVIEGLQLALEGEAVAFLLGRRIPQVVEGRRAILEGRERALVLEGVQVAGYHDALSLLFELRDPVAHERRLRRPAL